jgi:hypothetical protein
MIFSSSHKAREWEAKFQRLYSLFFPLRHWLKWMANILKIGIIGITIHAYAAPTITTNLANKVAISGTAISLQISAYDIAPISYQWHHNNADIQAATNAILTFSSVDPTNAGRYSVTVTNSSGSMTSRTATLTVMSYPKPTTIVAWGDNSYGQTNTPLMETNVVALAGGQLQTVFLRQDGTLGDFGNAIASPSTYSLLPHVAAVATEGFYGLALGIDGTPVSYGLTYYSGSSDVPAYVTNAVETAIGNPRLALLDNGTLVGWVPNPNYYYPSDPAHILSYIVNLSNVVAIATSGGGVNTGSHCLALKSDHTVVAFGVSQVGDSIVVPSLTNVVAISGGASFSLALKIDGTVTAWGDNSYGQTNVPSGLSNVMAIATGDNHSLALKSNGTVVAWGDNSYGQCNVPVTLSNVVLVTAGSRHSAALTKQPKIVVPPQSLAASSPPHNFLWLKNRHHIYDESKIKTLSSLEHIRLRTGMYIGRIGTGAHPDDGCYVLLKEVVDNAIDEYIMGHGKEVADQHRGQPRGRARLRARHPARQGRGLRFQDQHRREIQRRGVSIQRRPQRRRHEGGQRAVEKLFRAQPSRRRICRGEFQDRQIKKRRHRQDEGAERHAHRVRAGRKHFQGQRIPAGTHRAPAAALQLS